MTNVEVRHDEDRNVHEYGFESDGAWVPIGSIPSSTVAGHVQRANDTERAQFPQRDA